MAFELGDDGKYGNENSEGQPHILQSLQRIFNIIVSNKIEKGTPVEVG